MSAVETDSRDRIVGLARKWTGTPYRHQASRHGVGADCLGLIRGVWRALYGIEPEALPAYAADWAERAAGDALLAAAGRHCRRVGPGAMQPGDIVVFRWRTDLPAKHAGILVDPARFIHAYERAGVVESALVPAWRRRIAGVFVFPGV